MRTRHPTGGQIAESLIHPVLKVLYDLLVYSALSNRTILFYFDWYRKQPRDRSNKVSETSGCKKFHRYYSLAIRAVCINSDMIMSQVSIP